MRSVFNTLAFAGLLSFAAPAAIAADAKKIGSLPDDVVVHERVYGFNPDLSRAWVEVHYSRTHFDEAPMERMKVAVEGLSYDSAKKAVVYESGGQHAVCAEARERGFGPFRHTFMSPTGACAVALDRQMVTVDNGFHVWEAPKLAVKFSALGDEARTTRVAESGQISVR